ncbi:thioredoxin domain-containing protein [Fortiea sp. LEGE XX443]|uniref:DsbA family protein n=1 Tax=Fortiea sp. LEGE XX443 TaxID=1828611 RepID=UPI001880274F|nr:thioredoxin domain-containing protein [Fortiea sp. LEGE XX443]MBE9004211.1 thioredoxin domain-containing protein [Fortiea sp. LEGE XX443]
MRQLFQYLRTSVILCLLCLVLGWSLPAQAATQVDSKLEQQVLQILRDNPKAIINAVQGYQLKQQETLQQAQQAFLQDLKTDPQGVIGDSPTTGATKSKTVLVEFSDFQCPYCAEVHKTLKSVVEKHKDNLTLVYKNLPLTLSHTEALPAAQAAWAAKQQGKFWEYHDALFTNQKQLGETLYLDLAKKLNLDLPKFESDRKLAKTAIEKDVQLADKLGITGTPFLVINTENYTGAVQASEIEGRLANAS